MTELKSCPFCGGEAVPVYSDKGSLYTSNILMLSAKGTVKCKKCEVRLPRIYSRVSKAIGAWNKRAEPSRPRGHWKMVSQHETPPTYVYSCSECSHKSFGFYNFCPNCGADMRKDGATNADVES